MIAVNDEGTILAPALIGEDPELQPVFEHLVSTVGARNFRNLTGSPPTLASPVVKLLNIRETLPRAWHDLATVFCPRDFLRFRLTGQRQSDPSAAAQTELFNPRTRTWSKQLLARLDVNAAAMPTLAMGDHLAGRVTGNRLSRKWTASRHTCRHRSEPSVCYGDRLLGIRSWRCPRRTW